MEQRPDNGKCPLAGIPGKPDESNSDDNSGNTGSAKERAVSSPHRDLENAQLNPSREVPRKKLCGYLNKLGVKGPIKAWKSRWFFYDENKCHLLYYRTAQDVNPLGSIDLSSAAFGCKMEASEGVFEIRTPNKVFVLKVSTMSTRQLPLLAIVKCSCSWWLSV